MYTPSVNFLSYGVFISNFLNYNTLQRRLL
nr:MAG TPA: hypothetical protein [Caudoviricetes sp.]